MTLEELRLEAEFCLAKVLLKAEDVFGSAGAGLLFKEVYCY